VGRAAVIDGPVIHGTALHAGEAEGPTLVLTEPLSFWGGFDPRTGFIVDASHPQRGVKLGGHILLMPETRGSGTAPGAIAEAIRLGTAPLGIIMMRPDINLAIGASVAQTLYGKACPVIAVTRMDYEMLADCQTLTINMAGSVF
jgi:uncharacterized protein